MVILLLLLSLFSSGSLGAEILLHPKSRLAAIGVEVAFHCKINNSIDPYWVVNNQATHSTYQKDRLTAQGFIFEEGEEGGVAMLTLKVNTTDDKNQTQLFCFSLPGRRSLTATLLTITDPPISQNPSIANPTASSITLKWSPPFLWPGVPIEYYDIFITNMKGKSTYHHVNTTFSDVVVSFASIADNTHLIVACEDLYFSISAVTSNHEKLPSFTVSGGYIPMNLSSSLEVNTTVLFDVNSVPHIVVNVKVLPLICSYQELSITILITNESGNTTLLGPYQHLGSDTHSQIISPGHSKYSLWTTVELITGTVTSDEHIFDLSFNCQDPPIRPKLNIVYAIIATIVVIVILAIILLLIITCAYCWERRKASDYSSGRLVMVDNPIYEEADQYQNLQSQLCPHTANTAAAEIQQASIHSVVGDERRVPTLEECQKNVIEPAGNLSDDEEEKYVTIC